MTPQNLINFRKRELTFKSIREVVQTRNNLFNFSIEQPLYSFVQELPYLSSDMELYELSNFLEPKTSKERKK
jgi:hypothetical protein